jgi:ArsR family transcriptional regulator
LAKNAIDLAQMAQQLSSPQRLEMLEYLAQAPRSVEALAQLAGLSVANTSRHLQQLRKVGMVRVEKSGKQRIYHLAGDDIVQLLRCLRLSAEKHLAEIDRILGQYWQKQGELPAINLETLKQLAESHQVLLLDVRPPEEYARGHIPSALNVPPDQIETFLEHFDPRDKQVVAYCRGPYCTFSHRAVVALRQRAIQALRLEEGLPEWRASGGQIEVGFPKGY